MTSLKLEEFLNLQKDWKFVSVLSFGAIPPRPFPFYEENRLKGNRFRSFTMNTNTVLIDPRPSPPQ